MSRQLASTTHPIPFRMVSKTGNLDDAIGLQSQITVWLSKNCGPLVPALGAVTEIGKCLYALQPHADDRDTLGSLVLHAEAPTAYNENERIEIVNYDPFAAPTGQGVVVSAGFGAGDSKNLADLKTIVRLIATEFLTTQSKGLLP